MWSQSGCKVLKDEESRRKKRRRVVGGRVDEGVKREGGMEGAHIKEDYHFYLLRR